MNKRLFQQLFSLLFTAALFLLFNLSMFRLVTWRLTNNFSGVQATGMVDVSRYLPHNPQSDLARTGASLTLVGDLPILDGAAALVPVYASVIDSLYPAGSVTFEGGVFDGDNYTGENFLPDSVMQYKNTVRGYQAIVDGTTDILFCAAPSAAQAAYAAEQGVELCYVPIGLEGFVFFVNSENPVESLTADEIRAIYAGEITNWAEVGGPRRTINPVSRLEGSGSQTAMEAFMGEREIGKKSPFILTGASIGFSFRYYMDGIVGNEKVKMLAVNGIEPTVENIQNGSYPIIAEFYAIHRADNQNENIPVVLDWLLSEEGQRLIAATGYVPLNPES
ncbi:MAG: substrate-binding domain-containing protein [Clostridia bacterium]|nr:substrate-binding domain-containing protein [Clostridia bacterium]